MQVKFDILARGGFQVGTPAPIAISGSGAPKHTLTPAPRGGVGCLMGRGGQKVRKWDILNGASRLDAST